MLAPYSVLRNALGKSGPRKSTVIPFLGQVACIDHGCFCSVLDCLGVGSAFPSYKLLALFESASDLDFNLDHASTHCSDRADGQQD